MVAHATMLAVLALLDDNEEVSAEEADQLAHVAPEALLGEEATTAGDIYSVGALLYLCLTGRKPLPRGLRAVAPNELRDTLLFNSPPPLAELRPDLPRDLLALVSRAMTKDPDHRPDDCQELREVLGRLSPEPLVTGCSTDRDQAGGGTAGPIVPTPTPVAFSLADAQREAALRRERSAQPRPVAGQPAIDLPPPPVPDPPEADEEPGAGQDLDLDEFQTIIMTEPPVEEDAGDGQDLDLDEFQTIVMAEPPKEMDAPAKTSAGTPDQAAVDQAWDDLDPDEFPTIVFKKAPTAAKQVDPSGEIQPAGEQAQDHVSAVVPMDEILEEIGAPRATGEPAPVAKQPPREGPAVVRQRFSLRGR